MRREARPALPENEVISILQANAGELPHNIEFVELLLKIEQLDAPGLFLIFEDTLQGLCGTAVSAARIKKDNR